MSGKIYFSRHSAARSTVEFSKSVSIFLVTSSSDKLDIHNTRVTRVQQTAGQTTKCYDRKLYFL